MDSTKKVPKKHRNRSFHTHLGLKSGSVEVDMWAVVVGGGGEPGLWDVVRLAEEEVRAVAEESLSDELSHDAECPCESEASVVEPSGWWT